MSFKIRQENWNPYSAVIKKLYASKEVKENALASGLKCTSSFFGLPSRSLLSYTPSEFFRKALQCLPLSFLSLRARFLVHILLKVYSCRATFEAIPVPLDPPFSLRNGFEDRYKR